MTKASSTKPESKSAKSNRLSVILLVGLLLIGAGELARLSLHREVDPAVFSSNDNRLVESEGLILDLTPKLKDLLNTSVLNLSLPDALAAELFAQPATILGLADEAPHEKNNVRALQLRKFSWAISNRTSETAREDVSLWSALFQSVDYFERAGFKFVRSHFDDADRNLLHSDVTFEGQARDKDGRLILVKAEQRVNWRPSPQLPELASDLPKETANAGKSAKPATADQWRIVNWTQTKFETIISEQPFFAETLDVVVPDTELRNRLKDSIHERHILSRYEALSKHEKWEGPHPYFSVVSQDRHPSLSVVDIDQDGLDDVYVMARWGKNILLHNKGGFFEDVAPRYGLDIDGHCSSAIFADFDNDGDDDLMLGRTLVPSQYFQNEGGQFVDRTATSIDGDLPTLVTSVSAADYNSDGLLDVYLSTYSANMQEDENRDRGPPLKNPDSLGLLSDFLPEATAGELNRQISKRDYHRHLNNYGPPNLLLINRSGRFETAPENDQVAIWRHTYQASWNDYDQDGDPDLYLANDFAVNSLMRNDGEAGFVDIGTESGTTDIGFGMGASWGDYDNDGLADLYVSNMFSKAGRRITGSLKEIDPRFALMARGNSLFHNTESAFEKVSGLEAPALQVEKAGWSWSGQFVDFDNDGWLDVHTLSGYYSAPPEVAVKIDL